VRTLLSVDLYDDALNELRFAERAWGEAAPIQATIAWIHQKQGEFETGSKRFNLVRGAITTMRRAYPQFMAAGGEEMPQEMLKVIFPIAYWDLIRKYSNEHGLDPFLVAALVAQESTFVPDIKSYAKAVGLMQLMAPTGRQYARKTGTKYTASTLTNPEANIRLGTAYFADLVNLFGDVHLALASYNAGESPVRKWLNEKPGLPRDEFIDDIPYPQTQGYVKRILGTAEDYRRLYGDASKVDELVPAAKVKTTPEGVGAAPAPGSPASKPAQKKAPPKKKARGRKASVKRR
jgi:soluble lytic murein transglycosylase